MKGMWWVAVAALAGCVNSAAQRQRNELNDRTPAAGARGAVIELGWGFLQDQRPFHPPVVDKLAPKRYKGLVTNEANDLAEECNAGLKPFAELRRESSSQTEMAMVTLEPGSKEPYREVALRLRVGECASVDGPSAE